jgi:hypothetical protein
MPRAETEFGQNGPRDPDPAKGGTDSGAGVHRSVLKLIHALQRAEATRRRLPRGTRAYDDALSVEADLRDRIRAWSDVN